MLQKPNIKQRKSDASFKEDSILSSDFIGFFATAKKLDLHQICTTGIRMKKSTNQEQIRHEYLHPELLPQGANTAFYLL